MWDLILERNVNLLIKLSAIDIKRFDAEGLVFKCYFKKFDSRNGGISSISPPSR